MKQCNSWKMRAGGASKCLKDKGHKGMHRNDNERWNDEKDDKISIGGFPFIVDEIRDWRKDGLSLKEEIYDYEIEYMKKHCHKCSDKVKGKNHCFEVNRWIDGVQERHCNKMEKAGTRKFRGKIKRFLGEHPTGTTHNQTYTNKQEELK